MEKIRAPFQGVKNIIRFNWHFYALSVGIIFSLILFTIYSPDQLKFYLWMIIILILSTTVISLSVSYYIYDWSDLYKLTWLDNLNIKKTGLIVNINAGFDETSCLLKEKYKSANLIVLDFYNPITHTEISIKRARQLYPPYPNTIDVKTTALPLADHSVDNLFIIFAAHEIRNKEERILFFKELHRVIKINGKIIITEHLRDIPNFLAYNIGFFHFYQARVWKRIFRVANFSILKEVKLTPFISTFILEANGNSL
jgi:ubiquinone/menaquinone biosynthesis C-methylase UbiE